MNSLRGFGADWSFTDELTVLTLGPAIAVLFGLLILFSCVALFSHRILPFSGKLGAAVGCTLLVLPSVGLTILADASASTALALVRAGAEGGWEPLLSISSLIVCGIAGVIGALAVNASGYAAVCFSQWSAGLLYPGLENSGGLEEESFEQSEDVRGILRLVLLLMIVASLLYSPLATAFFYSIMSSFLSAVEQLSALLAAIDSAGPTERESSLISVNEFRQQTTEFAITVGKSALVTAAIVTLPLFVLSIAVDLLSVLYRRFFRLGYAPTAVQLARFVALLALLGSGTYIFVEQLQGSFQYAPTLGVTDQT